MEGILMIICPYCKKIFEEGNDICPKCGCDMNKINSSSGIEWEMSEEQILKHFHKRKMKYGAVCAAFGVLAVAGTILMVLFEEYGLMFMPMFTIGILGFTVVYIVADIRGLNNCPHCGRHNGRNLSDRCHWCGGRFR